MLARGITSVSPPGRSTSSTRTWDSLPTLVSSGGSDLTLDFGFYQLVTIGDFVWKDGNGNGVQDAASRASPE